MSIEPSPTRPFRPAQPAGASSGRKRSIGPGGRLLAALADLACHRAVIVAHKEQSWASITFAGTRHLVRLEFRGAENIEAGECFIAFLPEHEFAIAGQLVADAAVTEVAQVADPACLMVTCELLLLEEG